MIQTQYESTEGSRNSERLTVSNSKVLRNLALKRNGAGLKAQTARQNHKKNPEPSPHENKETRSEFTELAKSRFFRLRC